MTHLASDKLQQTKPQIKKRVKSGEWVVVYLFQLDKLTEKIVN